MGGDTVQGDGDWGVGCTPPLQAKGGSSLQPQLGLPLLLICEQGLWAQGSKAPPDSASDLKGRLSLLVCLSPPQNGHTLPHSRAPGLT